MPSTDIESPFNFETDAQPGHDATILYCKGQLTRGENAVAFRAAVADSLRRDHTVIVDLGAVERLDRGGLEALVSLYSSARTAGATLKYRNLKVNVSDSHRHQQIPNVAA
jgi:anti-anti-sigma regulatory factor